MLSARRRRALGRRAALAAGTALLAAAAALLLCGMPLLLRRREAPSSWRGGSPTASGRSSAASPLSGSSSSSSGGSSGSSTRQPRAPQQVPDPGGVFAALLEQVQEVLQQQQQRAPGSAGWQHEILQLLQGWQRLGDPARGRSQQPPSTEAQQGRRLLDVDAGGAGAGDRRPAGLGGGALLAALNSSIAGGSNTTGLLAQQLLLPQLRQQGPAGQVLQLWLDRSAEGAAPDAWALGPSPDQGPAAWKAGCLCELQGEPVCDPATGRSFPSRCYAECQVGGPDAPGGACRKPGAAGTYWCAVTDRCNRPAAAQGIASPGPCQEQRREGVRPLAGLLGQLLPQLPARPALAGGGRPVLGGGGTAAPAAPPPPNTRSGSSGPPVQDTSLLGPLLEVLQGAGDQLGLAPEDTALLYYDSDYGDDNAADDADDDDAEQQGAGPWPPAEAGAVSRAAVAGKRRAARERLAGFAAAAAQRAAAGVQQGPRNSTLAG
jgi:hypothetical protein